MSIMTLSILNVLPLELYCWNVHFCIMTHPTFPQNVSIDLLPFLFVLILIILFIGFKLSQKHAVKYV